MAEFIGIDIQGLDKVQRLLKQLPKEARDAASESMGKYFIEVFKAYPAPRYVSVKSAGGWMSERQRRYVMAMIRKGVIKVPYRRTQRLRRGWRMIDKGEDALLVNETPYAAYVQDKPTQSRMMRMRSWDVIQDLTVARMPQALRKAVAAIQKVISKLGA